MAKASRIEPKPTRAVRRAVVALSDRRRSDGSWAGNCRARLLESCLALLLLRDLGDGSAAVRELDRYCRASLLSLSTRRGSWRVDEAFTARLAESVLGGSALPAARDAALCAALDADRHASRRRTRLMLDTLLALAGHDAAPDVPHAGAGQGRDGGHHRWAELIAAAIRLWRTPAPDSPDLRLLAGAQGPDGGWEHHILATLVILLVLARTGLAPGVLARGRRFVLSRVGPDGGLPFITDEDTWVTALASLVLAEAGVSPKVLRPSADHLLGQQMYDGGWAYSPGVTQADADDTSVAVSFLARLGSPGALRAARAGVGYLLALQNPDGGFPTFTRGAPSEAEITAKCVHALLSSPGGVDERHEAARRAWRWLVDAQRPDGGFAPEWCSSPRFAVMHVIRAHHADRTSPGPRVCHAGETVDRCVRFLTTDATGAMGVTTGEGNATDATLETGTTGGPRPASGDAHPLATAYTVTALAQSPHPPPAPLRDGVRRLLADDPDAPCEPDSLGPRPFVYDVPILRPIYRLAALSHASRHRPPTDRSRTASASQRQGRR
ncbi:prenyltransferase/squalene oxidase repeat-containing protein [Embleya hyalina]|uniref:Sporulenol synthase n=1 Tax=Embleya hyalina TaxID=516124 RepID=A0A401YM41_9ACTN|nr:prenyltransferase/squalene oxidase repeat-containing protein [Embleya hyalina]GCD95683.1 sporulenol synthase [Embleya hyalina]